MVEVLVLPGQRVDAYLPLSYGRAMTSPTIDRMLDSCKNKDVELRVSRSKICFFR